MARARVLTEEVIEELPQTKAGRYDVHDGETPNLVLRIGTRTKVFVLLARFPGYKRSTRRTIEKYPKMSLEKARAIATDWNLQIKRGIDPAEEEKRSDRENRLEERRVFRSALVDFINWLPDRRFTRHVPDDIALIRRTLLDAPDAVETLKKTLADVTRDDLGEFFKNGERRMSEAYLLYGHLQQFFQWVTSPLHCKGYGILVNPLAGVTPGDVEVWKNARLDVLEAWELRAYWRAADETPYPYGPFFKALLLTVERRSAVAGMRWSELDPVRRVWRAPPTRVKGKLVEHLVPLSDQLMELLAGLRRTLPVGHGDYVFSSNHGQSPINGFGAATAAFRARAEAALREIDPTKVMRHFVLHDVRRVDRSALSALDVPVPVAEGILNHGKQGIEGLYDQFRHLPQRRRAMAKLHDRLGEVIEGSKGDYWDDEPAGGSWEDFDRQPAAREAGKAPRGSGRRP